MRKWKSLSKKKRAAILVSSALVVVCVVVGVYFGVREEPGVKVELTQVQTTDVVQTINPTATIESAHTDTFRLEKGTIPLQVNVKPGDRVKQGDVLATFDVSALSKQVSEKQLAYNKAKAAYDSSVNSSQTAKEQLAQTKQQAAVLEAKIKKLQSTSGGKNQTGGSAADMSAIIQGMLANMTPEQLQALMQQYIASGGSSDMFSAMLSGSMGGLSTELATAQAELLKLQTQQVLLEAQAGVSLADVYKLAMDSALESLNNVKTQLGTLSSGWVAQQNGVVTAVNIVQGTAFGGAPAEGTDISSLLSSLTGGGVDADTVTKMITDMMDASSVGISVDYFDGLQAVFTANKYDVLKLKVGQSVKITSVTGSFTGKIEYISPTAKASGGLGLGMLTGSSSGSAGIVVKASIDNPDESIIIGLDVDVEVQTGQAVNAVAVPMESLAFDGEKKFVYVYNEAEQTVSRRDVETGSASDTMYEIKSGLQKGEMIVRSPSSKLEDGAAVSVVSGADASSTK